MIRNQFGESSSPGNIALREKIYRQGMNFVQILEKKYVKMTTAAVYGVQHHHCYLW